MGKEIRKSMIGNICTLDSNGNYTGNHIDCEPCNASSPFPCKHDNIAYFGFDYHMNVFEDNWEGKQKTCLNGGPLIILTKDYNNLTIGKHCESPTIYDSTNCDAGTINNGVYTAECTSKPKKYRQGKLKCTYIDKTLSCNVIRYKKIKALSKCDTGYS